MAGKLQVAKVADRVRQDEAFALEAATSRLCGAASRDDLEEIKVMLDLGLEVNSSDANGRTALHYACAKPKIEPELVQLLIGKKASPVVQDFDGLTPLQLCELRGGGSEAFAMLLDADTDEAGRSNSRSRPMKSQSLAPKLASEGSLISRSEVIMGPLLSETLKSTVYRATWRGTPVVAKVVLENVDDGAQEELTQELIHEIQVLASIHHPDLVMFLGAVVTETPVMFITEYMGKGDLERYYMAMRKEKQSPNWHVQLGQQVLWCSAVSRALCFLHNAREPIIHRDLKPLNLLLTNTLEMKITDFGISKKIAGPSATPKLKFQRLNTVGVGSYHYMAPEVVRSGQYDTKADIYSFALIMYFISSGRDPFWERGRNPEVVLQDYGVGKEPRPNVAEAHAALRGIMKDAWAVDPKDRPTAGELAERFGEVPVPQGCGCSVQ